MPLKISPFKRIFSFCYTGHVYCTKQHGTENMHNNTEYFLDATNTVIASHSDACTCVSLGSSRIVTVSFTTQVFFPSQSSVLLITQTCVGLSECSSVLAMCSITAGAL